MKVFTVFSPENADVLRVWERSWRLQGWKPGLLTVREVDRHGKKAAQVRGSRYADLDVRTINYTFKRPRTLPVRIGVKRYGVRGWKSAPVVLFPSNFSESDILQARPV